jgi:predicted nucleic acid-binding protein
LRRIVLDASAILVLFRDSRGAETVQQLIVSALHGQTQLFMSVINWGEVYYSTWRAQGEPVAQLLLTKLSQLPIEIEDATWIATKRAAEYKANYALPYADCFVASLAHRVRGEIVTSDSDFSIVRNQIPITFL